MSKRLSSTLIVDFLGVGLVAACLAVGLWFVVLRPGSAGEQIRESQAEVDELELNLRQMRLARDERQLLHQQHQEMLGKLGLLPQAAPVERDLRVITALARASELRLDEFTPEGTSLYPSVREARYRLRTQGRFSDHLRFLRGFEQSASWADITSFKLVADNPHIAEDQSGEIVFSLYSALETDSVAMDTGER